jgi:superfamily II DNA/RNA helicase
MREILHGVKTTAGDFSESELSKAINRTELVGDIVRTFQDKATNRQTLVFAVDIAHSKAIEADFKAAGIRCEHIDAYTPQDDREQIIQDFRDSHVQVLTSVNVLGIGFDVPDASCAILARPTLSEALSMQQVGRVLRPADGKQDALLLDHAGNTLRFGLPKDFRIPDLDDHDRPTTKEKRKQLKMLSCKECSFVLEPSQRTCPNCGTDRVKHNSNLVYRDGVLVEYDGDGDGKQHYSQADQRAWYSAFKWFAERQPRFKNPRGWTYYIFLSKFSVKPPWEWWETVKSEIPDPEQTRWIKYHTIRQAKSYHKPKKAPPRKSRRCRVCNSGHVETVPGKGPHAAGRRCGDCGKFLGWIPKKEFESIPITF